MGEYKIVRKEMRQINIPIIGVPEGKKNGEEMEEGQ